jgi:hypothetical protein
MLPNILNTNEVKDAAGVEVEFNPWASVDRSKTYAAAGESYAAPHRLKISHQESGSGVRMRRRSVVRVDKTTTGVDSSPVTVSAYLVLDVPVGDLSANTEAKNVIAELLSFCATTGAATTVLFDCTGNGASVLISGGL